ncbi:unnamed protein product [Parajaminaea phylloscopi]
MSTTQRSAEGLLVLSSKAVEKCLQTMSAKKICQGQSRVFRELSAQRRRKTSAESTAQDGQDIVIDNPQRLVLGLPHHVGLFMPARFGSTTTCKIVGVPSSSQAPPGLPGSTVVLDPATAKVKALVDASNLTALRTAAGSMLATMLYRPIEESQDPLKMVIFGGGRQAYYHAWMMAKLYGSRLTHVTFVTRRPLRETELPNIAAAMGSDDGARQVQGKADTVQVDHVVARGVTSAEDAARELREADVVCCCTPSTQPLFRFADLKRGAHLNLVGSYKPAMQEVEPELVREAFDSAQLIADSIEACSHEAGDLLKADIDFTSPNLREMGDVLEDAAAGRLKSNPSAVSLFKSVGVGIQDVVIAEDVVEEALRDGSIGSFVDY